MKKTILAAGFIFALLTTGCSQNIGNLEVAAVDSVENLKMSKATDKNRVEGESCIHNLLLIPFGRFTNRVQYAIDDAIQNGGKENAIEGDLLKNVKISLNTWTVFLYGQNCINVEGNLVKVED